MISENRRNPAGFKKLQPPLPDVQISALLEALSGFEVVGTNASLVLDAHQLAIAGLRIVDPFRSMPG